MASKGIEGAEPQATMERHSRPLGVSVLAIFLVIGGVGGILLGFRGQTSDGLYLHLNQGLIFLISGLGLWKGKAWAWTLVVIINAIGFVVGIAELSGQPSGGNIYVDVAMEGINLLFIYYVSRRNVMEYFGKTSFVDEFV